MSDGARHPGRRPLDTEATPGTVLMTVTGGTADILCLQNLRTAIAWRCCQMSGLSQATLDPILAQGTQGPVWPATLRARAAQRLQEGLPALAAAPQKVLL